MQEDEDAGKRNDGQVHHKYRDEDDEKSHSERDDHRSYDEEGDKKSGSSGRILQTFLIFYFKDLFKFVPCTRL